MVGSVPLDGMSVALRSEEFAEIRVIRGGREVFSFAGKVNTLDSTFVTAYRSEVTSNSDVNNFKRIILLRFRSGTYLFQDVDVVPDDVSVDETAVTMVLLKNFTASTSGTIDNVVMICDGKFYTRVSFPPVQVNANDQVIFRYVAKLYLTMSNPSGILSDAVSSFTGLVKRIYYRLKGTETRSLRIASVQFVDSQGNVVLSVSTNNDSTNYIVRIPSTAVTRTIEVKTIRLCDSSGIELIRFTKPEPILIPATSSVRLSIAIQ